MQGIRAALGDGVDLSACGLAEFGRVVGRLRLELFDGIDGVDIWSARRTATSLREEHLVIVRAVNVVLVVEAADAVEADQAGASVLNDVRGEENEVAPVARRNGEVRDQRLANCLRDLGFFRVEDGRGRVDDNFGGD